MNIILLQLLDLCISAITQFITTVDTLKLSLRGTVAYVFVVHLCISALSLYQDLKPSNIVVKEDCTLKVRLSNYHKSEES